MEEPNLLRQKRKGRNQNTPANGASTSFHVTSLQHITDEASTRLSKRLRHKMAAKTEEPTNNFRPMDILSNDTLANILFDGFIDQTPRQLASISCVCKRFKLVAETSLTSLDLRKVELPLLSQIINRYTNLCRLDFSNIREFGDRHMQLLLPVREKLQSLKLRGTKVTDRSIESFFGLTARERSIPIEILDLSGTMISQKAAVTIAICCPDLESLKLSNCQGITDAFMECVSTHLTKLQALDVSMCPITAKGCTSLFCAPSLREVDISACPELNAHAIRALVTGQIGCDDKDAPDSVDVLDENETELLRRKGNVSQLISISAQYMKEIDANLLDVMTSYAPHLRRLDLRHYQEIDNTDLSSFKMSLRKMQQNGVQVAFSRSNIGTTLL
ncbi:leucine-rich repeat protein [Skeletonema marinoi]|uniref:Leucine-rich repeat protein n=1 Tax=Skeletonema marinoi TaxID=267567 RepID=A0AAD8XXN9_9STRA|nr:leucine-rich repeat protein [Skeletonema marinoi]